MNFSEAMFYENDLTSDFHTNTVISRRVCLLVKMASKTVIRHKYADLFRDNGTFAFVSNIQIKRKIVEFY